MNCLCGSTRVIAIPLGTTISVICVGCGNLISCSEVPEEIHDELKAAGIIDKENIVNLELLAEKLDSLSGEVFTHKESLIRHIAVRRELLGKSAILDIHAYSIQQLLELKTENDWEIQEMIL